MAVNMLAYAAPKPMSFLQRGLGIAHLQGLRLGKQTYRQMLESLPSLRDCHITYSSEKFPETFLPGDDIAPSEDPLLFFDMWNFPVDTEWFDHAVKKALCSGLPLYVYARYDDGERPALVKLPAVRDGAGGEQETARLTAPAGCFADLRDVVSVLRLFSNAFSLRFFNVLEVSRTGYFRKFSADKAKIAAEYAFLSAVPEAVRPWFPHVGELVRNTAGASYEIEIIPSLDVGKSLLNGVFDNETTCAALLRQLESYLAACPKKRITTQEYRQAAAKAFLDKTRERAGAVCKLPVCGSLDRICELFRLPSFRDFAEAYCRALERDIRTAPEQELVFSHGDLFFSNILFNPLSGGIKLVDPRGLNAGDVASGFLPAWYDLAKLSHSFLGGYDLIAYDLAEVRLRPDLTPGLHIPSLPGLLRLRNCFLNRLPAWKIPLRRLRLYEGSLFLSMLPLHADSPARMACQLVRAVELYEYAVKGNEERGYN
ncbi:MAG: hypothetical protein LBJ47_09710 [Tannerella sp.]|jgi:hypothetical protein|nr:hypothetical protein [Tannerella sp.]